MTPRIWMKFGGGALVDGAATERVCRLVMERAEQGPGLVVSAHGGVTEMLEALARRSVRGEQDLTPIRIRHRSILSQLELDPELLDPLLRELHSLCSRVAARGRLHAEDLDHALSFGERMSARVVAAALRAAGLSATPVDAFDLGLTTDSRPGRARPLGGFEREVRAAVEEVPGTPVVTGFLGRDAQGRLTTLGRNGSDLTAALLAEATSARELLFWKCVPGVLSADPELVKDARVIDRVDFEEARELALFGAGVLHPDALPAAARSGARVRVLDVDHPTAAGTEIVPVPAGPRHGTVPVGIASEAELVSLELDPEHVGELDRPLTELFALLGRHHIEPRFVAGGPAGLTVFAARTPIFSELAAELSKRVKLGSPVAAVAVIGHGGVDLGARALATLEARGISVRHVFLSERRASQVFLVAPADHEGAARALHAGLLDPAPAG